MGATGQAVTPPVTAPVTPPAASVASSITISGPAARSGTVNTQLDSPLLVRVLDDSGNGVASARVIFRVISGRGKLSERGNGRAVGVQTDRSGYARANFTPTDGGTITVRASTDDISTTVTFTITTGAASTTTTTGVPRTGGTTPEHDCKSGCACRCCESSADVMGRRWCDLRTRGRESPKIRVGCG